MSNTKQVKAALVSVLVAAAFLGRSSPPDSATIALLLFGIGNVVFSPPGTTWIRGLTLIGVLAAFVWRGDVSTLVGLLALCVWPPAYMVAWAIARERDVKDGTKRQQSANATQARIGLAAVIASVTVASLAYRGLAQSGLDQTAALFVGLPAILAIVVVFGVSPRSAAGVACKAVTIGLLVSLVLLWEGILCVVMSAPLLYAVALFITCVFEDVRPDYKNPQSWLSCIAVLAVMPMSMEGVSDRTSLNRNEEVSETRVVAATSQAVERALFEAPRFDRALPLYLRAGFPRPTFTRIDRGSGATRWIVRLRGGEMKVNGMEPRAGDLVLELAESRPGFVRWRAVADDSHMTHFLSWQEAIVHWESVGPDSTKVTWTLRYRRGLDPAWYFGPWQRYATRLAAGYLIDAVATP